MTPLLVLAAGPAYSTHGVTLFNGVTEGTAVMPSSLSATLILTGMVVRLIGEQIKASTGQRPAFATVIGDAVVTLVLLALHGWLAHNIWTSAQIIAVAIYPDSKLTAVMGLLGGVAGRLKDYTFTILDVGSALRDSAVVLFAVVAWILTLLAHWQLEVLQVCIYNVVYAFAPLLLGLHMFGFDGRKIWVSAIVEVSSWSITLAIVYRTIDATLTEYLHDAQNLDFGNTHFLDVISMLGFLSSLPFMVPIVTGRLIGSSALGALANVNFGNTMADAVLAKGRSLMSTAGGSIDPGERDASSHTAAQAKRPGDV